MEYINEYRTVCGKVINRYSIAGTRSIDYAVWEFAGASILDAGHSTITFIDGKLYGEVRSRRVPADIDKLPAWTRERVAAVQAWRASLETFERSLVALAYPEFATITTPVSLQPR